ncbi:hypothetical protein DDB_G0287169 [Dictyostelium discoideum AX4]|uniref:Putative uncharacterized protein DDB_G0287169 n=1 Tax=Dictyostelium discoideum TaxID=44689 RepID=Y7169_DICDI|nr:hypothetical protein DDB_G0287169 [Dictyostelium discoideum AX4]Q54KQ5.1 RecName: Full=Putative uncharacterized protein DDB_G0287169 [Dictyostelium discoideum]EAL63859.1 hypothetical protein DDB_G0287169 [Dictyostelium discoideum AX4]|eukprot:XP_637375.1 hypothetical protein DDB_G0287169 [Dictyostelium discoideum AX4]
MDNNFRCIAFDLGGVLFSAGKEFAKAEWSSYGYDVVLIHDELVSEKAQQLRKGMISDNEFWNIYLKSKVPSNYDVDLIKQAYYRGYILDEDLSNWMKNTLKKPGNNYKLVAFSGNIPSRIQYLEDKYHFRSLFDAEAYSFDCGATKPDNYFIEYLIKICFPQETKDVVLKHGEPLIGQQLSLFQELGKQILYLDDSVKDSAPAKRYNINTFIYERGHINKLFEKYPNLNK